jgi:hypothetical protein
MTRRRTPVSSASDARHNSELSSLQMSIQDDVGLCETNLFRIRDFYFGQCKFEESVAAAKLISRFSSVVTLAFNGANVEAASMILRNDLVDSIRTLENEQTREFCVAAVSAWNRIVTTMSPAVAEFFELHPEMFIRQ